VVAGVEALPRCPLRRPVTARPVLLEQALAASTAASSIAIRLVCGLMPSSTLVRPFWFPPAIGS
jgi:hypothetical protein